MSLYKSKLKNNSFKNFLLLMIILLGFVNYSLYYCYNNQITNNQSIKSKMNIDSRSINIIEDTSDLDCYLGKVDTIINIVSETIENFKIELNKENETNNYNTNNEESYKLLLKFIKFVEDLNSLEAYIIYNSNNLSNNDRINELIDSLKTTNKEILDEIEIENISALYNYSNENNLNVNNNIFNTVNIKINEFVDKLSVNRPHIFSVDFKHFINYSKSLSKIKLMYPDENKRKNICALQSDIDYYDYLAEDLKFNSFKFYSQSDKFRITHNEIINNGGYSFGFFAKNSLDLFSKNNENNKRINMFTITSGINIIKLDMQISEDGYSVINLLSINNKDNLSFENKNHCDDLSFVIVAIERQLEKYVFNLIIRSFNLNNRKAVSVNLSPDFIENSLVKISNYIENEIYKISLYTCSGSNYSDLINNQNIKTNNNDNVFDINKNAYYIQKQELQIITQITNNTIKNLQRNILSICNQNDSSNQIYSNCDFISLNKTCLKCKDEFYNYNGLCVTECPQEYYSSKENNECKPCIAGCSKCNNSISCLVCNKNFYYYENKCLSECPVYTTPTSLDEASRLECISCGEDCEVCNFNNSCSKCKSKFLYNGKCIETCPKNTYSVFNPNNCLNCDSNCKSCISSKNNCIECYNNYYLHIKHNKCYQDCPIGTFKDNELMICSDCNDRCSSCDSKDNCQTCKLGFNLHEGKCVSSCPIGTTSIYGICIACENNCNNCLSNSPSICIECNKNTLLNKNSKCVSKCENGYFPDFSTRKCSKCIKNCEECLDNKTCSSCFLGYFNINNKECISECPYGYTDIDRTCSKCNEKSNCKTCLSSNISKCTTCFEQDLLYNGVCISSEININNNVDNNISDNKGCPLKTYKIGKECKDCHESCLTCNNSNTCLECKEDMFNLNGKCVYDCGEEYKANIYSNIKVCNKCKKNNCKSCNNDVNMCDECQKNYFLFNGECLANGCPASTFYDKDSNTCLRCGLNCEKCNSIDTCEFCNNNYYLQKDYLNINNSVCLNDCPENYYKDSALRECIKCNIADCNICDNNYCYMCSDNKYLLDYKECLSECPNGYTNSNYYNPSNDTLFYSTNLNKVSIFNCIKCNYPCQTCEDGNPNRCTKCLDNLILNPEKNICSDSCPEGQVLVKNECIHCKDSNCKSCYEDGYICSICKDNYFLLGNSCVEQCPDMYYIENNSCLKCNENCFNCLDKNTCINCDKNYYLFDNNCVSFCPEGYAEIENYLSSAGYSQYYKSTLPFNNKNSILIKNKKNSSIVTNSILSKYKMLTSKTEEGFGICSECHDTNCTKCNSNLSTCIKCNKNFNVYNGNCVEYCPSGYYLNDSESVCYPCKTKNCEACSNNTNKLNIYNSFNYVSLNNGYVCNKCYNNLVLLNNECIETCPNGYRKNDNVCELCTIDNCQSCSDNKQHCNICSKAYFKLSKNIDNIHLFDLSLDTDIQCVKRCPEGYYHDIISSYCLKCPLNCVDCINSFKCLKCSHNYFLSLNEKCIEKCPLGQIGIDASSTTDMVNYNHNTTNVCKPCPENCDLCSLDDINICLVCSEKYYLNDNNVCKTNCSNGYYANSLTKQCEKCQLNCESCSGYDQCDKCTEGMLLITDSFNDNLSKCTDNCPDLYTEKNGKCLPCDTLPDCNKCDDENTNICIECKDNKLILDGACLEECPLGYYKQEGTNKCLKCKSGCIVCNNIYSCEQCLVGYSLINLNDNINLFNNLNSNKESNPIYQYYNTHCVEDCGINKVSINGVCENCNDTNCLNCDNNKDCLVCKEDFYLYSYNGEKGICIEDCGHGLFNNYGICSQCKDNNCEKCSNDYDCQKCKPGFLLFDNSVCITDKCPKGYSNYNNKCIPCDKGEEKDCLICDSDDINICLTCKNNKILYDGKCVDVCPISYARIDYTNNIDNSYETQCIKCPENCNGCSYTLIDNTLNLECFECNKDYKLTINKECKLSCEDGYTSVDNKCLPCKIDNCISCELKNIYSTEWDFDCTKCNYNYIVSSSLKNCVKNCKSNEYIEESICYPCPLNCNSCYDTTGICKECNEGYDLIIPKDQPDMIDVLPYCSRKSDYCEEGMVFSNKENKCIKCVQENCISCDENNLANCLECNDSTLLDNGKCVNSCPINSYLPNSNNDFYSFECLTCSINCEKCIDYDNCLECKKPYVLQTFYDYSLCQESCDEGYVNINGSCEECSDKDKCSECRGSDKNSCKKCKPGYVLKNNNCVLECGDDYYLELNIYNALNCVKCNLNNCKTCLNNNICINCEGNYVLQEGICVKECSNGYSLSNNSSECIKCVSPRCKMCYEDKPDICLLCEQGYYLKDNQCVTNCGLGHYSNYDRKCKPCEDKNCLLCNSQNNCISCKDNYALIDKFSSSNMSSKNRNSLIKFDFSNKSLINLYDKIYNTVVNMCIEECPSGYVKNESNKCIKCSQDECENCMSTNIDYCTSCKINYLLNGKCYDICPEQYYSSTNNSFNCLPCNYNCKSCLSDDICTSCKHGYYLKDNKCISKCNENKIYDSDGDICITCNDKNCLDCNINNLSVCNYCKTPYLLHDNKCVDKCPSSYYSNYNSNNVCTKCIENCDECDNYGYCNVCSPNYSLYKVDSIESFCVKTCPNGYYEEVLNYNKECKICSSKNCNKCNSEDSKLCLECKEGYFLYQGACIESGCPIGNFYCNEKKECLPCKSNCKECLNNIGCVKCENNYKLLNNNCVESCPIGYVENNNKILSSNYNNNNYSIFNNSKDDCIKCRSSCYSCNIEDLTKCTRCINDNFYLNSITGECSEICTNGFYKDEINKECIPCKDDCELCTDYDNCTLCKERLILIDGKCKDIKCEDYTAFSNRKCSLCSDSFNCLKCSNNNLDECLICTNDKYLLKGICYDLCPNGYTENKKTKTCDKCKSTNCNTCKINEDSTQICNSCKSNYSLMIDDKATKENNNKLNCVNCDIRKNSFSFIDTCIECNINNCQRCGINKSVFEQLKDINEDFDTYNKSKSFLNNLYNTNNSFKNEVDDKLSKLKSGKANLVSSVYNTIIECNICEEDYILINGSCHNNCPDGYFKKGQSCIKCGNNCLKCLDNLSCLKCSSNSVFVNNECLSKCPEGYTKLENNTCIKCSDENCEKCSGERPDICLQCPGNFILMNNECIKECPLGYTKKEGSCLPCGPNCSSCNTNECLKCNIDYFIKDNKCTNNCGEGYFVNTHYGKCQECVVSNCAYCDSNVCKKCETNYSLLGNQCLNICPDGFYKKSISDYASKQLYNTCEKCMAGCSKCNSEDICLECIPPMKLFNNKCLIKCPDNMADVNGRCQLCDDPNCKECESTDLSQCIKCSKGVLYDKICVDKCFDGTFLNEKTNECDDCDLKCKTCSKFFNNCDSCNDGLELVNSDSSNLKTCKNKCPDSFIKVDDKCQNCSIDYCNTCLKNYNLDSYKCIECQAPYLLNNEECVSQCPDNMHHNLQENKCKECPKGCNTCTTDLNNKGSVNNVICLSCKDGYYLDNDNLCTTICPTGYIGNCESKVCERCDISCLSCASTNSDDCLDCNINYIKQDRKCVYYSNCLKGYWPNLINKICEKCSIYHCSDCTDAETCIECDREYSLKDGKCVREGDAKYLIKEALLLTPNSSFKTINLKKDLNYFGAFSSEFSVSFWLQSLNIINNYSNFIPTNSEIVIFEYSMQYIANLKIKFYVSKKNMFCYVKITNTKNNIIDLKAYDCSEKELLIWNHFIIEVYYRKDNTYTLEIYKNNMSESLIWTNFNLIDNSLLNNNKEEEYYYTSNSIIDETSEFTFVDNDSANLLGYKLSKFIIYDHKISNDLISKLSNTVPPKISFSCRNYSLCKEGFIPIANGLINSGTVVSLNSLINKKLNDAVYITYALEFYYFYEYDQSDNNLIDIYYDYSLSNICKPKSLNIKIGNSHDNEDSKEAYIPTQCQDYYSYTNTIFIPENQFENNKWYSIQAGIKYRQNNIANIFVSIKNQNMNKVIFEKEFKLNDENGRIAKLYNEALIKLGNNNYNSQIYNAVLHLINSEKSYNANNQIFKSILNPINDLLSDKYCIEFGKNFNCVKCEDNFYITDEGLCSNNAYSQSEILFDIESIYNQKSVDYNLNIKSSDNFAISLYMRKLYSSDYDSQNNLIPIIKFKIKENSNNVQKIIYSLIENIERDYVSSIFSPKDDNYNIIKHSKDNINEYIKIDLSKSIPQFIFVFIQYNNNKLTISINSHDSNNIVTYDIQIDSNDFMFSKFIIGEEFKNYINWEFKLGRLYKNKVLSLEDIEMIRKIAPIDTDPSCLLPDLITGECSKCASNSSPINNNDSTTYNRCLHAVYGFTSSFLYNIDSYSKINNTNNYIYNLISENLPSVNSLSYGVIGNFKLLDIGDIGNNYKSTDAIYNIFNLSNAFSNNNINAASNSLISFYLEFNNGKPFYYLKVNLPENNTQIIKLNDLKLISNKWFLIFTYINVSEKVINYKIKSYYSDSNSIIQGKVDLNTYPELLQANARLNLFGVGLQKTNSFLKVPSIQSSHVYLIVNLWDSDNIYRVFTETSQYKPKELDSTSISNKYNNINQIEYCNLAINDNNIDICLKCEDNYDLMFNNKCILSDSIKEKELGYIVLLDKIQIEYQESYSLNQYSDLEKFSTFYRHNNKNYYSLNNVSDSNNYIHYNHFDFSFYFRLNNVDENNTIKLIKINSLEVNIIIQSYNIYLEVLLTNSNNPTNEKNTNNNYQTLLGPLFVPTVYNWSNVYISVIESESISIKLKTSNNYSDLSSNLLSADITNDNVNLKHFNNFKDLIIPKEIIAYNENYDAQVTSIHILQKIYNKPALLYPNNTDCGILCSKCLNNNICYINDYGSLSNVLLPSDTEYVKENNDGVLDYNVFSSSAIFDDNSNEINHKFKFNNVEVFSNGVENSSTIVDYSINNVISKGRYLRSNNFSVKFSYSSNFPEENDKNLPNFFFIIFTLKISNNNFIQIKANKRLRNKFVIEYSSHYSNIHNKTIPSHNIELDSVPVSEYLTFVISIYKNNNNNNHEISVIIYDNITNYITFSQEIVNGIGYITNNSKIIFGQTKSMYYGKLENVLETNNKINNNLSNLLFKINNIETTLDKAIEYNNYIKELNKNSSNILLQEACLFKEKLYINNFNSYYCSSCIKGYKLISSENSKSSNGLICVPEDTELTIPISINNVNRLSSNVDNINMKNAVKSLQFNYNIKKMNYKKPIKNISIMFNTTLQHNKLNSKVGLAKVQFDKEYVLSLELQNKELIAVFSNIKSNIKTKLSVSILLMPVNSVDLVSIMVSLDNENKKLKLYIYDEASGVVNSNTELLNSNIIDNDIENVLIDFGYNSSDSNSFYNILSGSKVILINSSISLNSFRLISIYEKDNNNKDYNLNNIAYPLKISYSNLNNKNNEQTNNYKFYNLYNFIINSNSDLKSLINYDEYLFIIKFKVSNYLNNNNDLTDNNNLLIVQNNYDESLLITNYEDIIPSSTLDTSAIVIRVVKNSNDNSSYIELSLNSNTIAFNNNSLIHTYNLLPSNTSLEEYESIYLKVLINTTANKVYVNSILDNIQYVYTIDVYDKLEKINNNSLIFVNKNVSDNDDINETHSFNYNSSNINIASSEKGIYIDLSNNKNFSKEESCDSIRIKKDQCNIQNCFTCAVSRGNNKLCSKCENGFTLALNDSICLPKENTVYNNYFIK